MLTWENQQANACHEFACLEYGKALRALQEQINQSPQQSSLLIVVTCLLFTVFEFLQGNGVASLIHLRGGWKILSQEGIEPSAKSQDWSADTELRSELDRTFMMMDRQVTLWLGLNSWSTPNLISCDLLMPAISVPEMEGFSTVEDASFLFIQILNEIFHQSRHRSWCKLRDSGTQGANYTTVKCQRSVTKLLAWHTRLQVLHKKLGESMDTETLHRILVMEMNYTTFLIGFGAWSEPEKTQLYRQKESQFRQVVSWATAVVLPVTEEVTKRMQRVVLANNGAQPDEKMYTSPTALFALYVGIIPPLFMVATKCQSLQLRMEAIELLTSRPWREGAWDSMTMARIAQRRAA